MRCARQAATVPKLETWSCEFKQRCFNIVKNKNECAIELEIILKMHSKLSKNLAKSTPKWYQILEKSTSGGVLDHFGDLLGAKS